MILTNRAQKSNIKAIAIALFYKGLKGFLNEKKPTSKPTSKPCLRRFEVQKPEAIDKGGSHG